MEKEHKIGKAYYSWRKEMEDNCMRKMKDEIKGLKIEANYHCDKKHYSHILKECTQIAEDREKQYGEASENFENIADMLLEMFGVAMSPAEIIEVMIAVKATRERHKHKADNVKDLINYWAIYLHLKEQRNGI